MPIAHRTLSHATPSRWRAVCPHCGQGTSRIERRWSDRLLNVLVPLRRYRCVNAACGWQGNLRTHTFR
jgi:hypothetical protein